MEEIYIVLLTVIVLALIIGLGFGGNYLYNIALNPDTPKDFLFASDTDTSDEEVSQDETSSSVTTEDQTWLLEESNYEDIVIY